MPALSRALSIALLLFAAASARADALSKLSHRDRLYDVAAFGGTLFVVGHPDLLLRSRDGGSSFESIAAGHTRQALFSIAFNARGEGAVVGRSGVLLVTSDGGESWTRGTVKLDEMRPSLFGVDVLDDGAIVAVGEFGMIVRSEDRGKTWTRSPYTIEGPVSATPPPGCPSLEEAGSENADVIQEARLTDVGFADAARGFIVGEFGLVLRSNDGGRTFQRENGCTDKTLHGLSVIDASHLLAVGADGSAIESTDGGSAWNLRETGTREHLFGVWADAERALVIGAAGTVLTRKGDGVMSLAKTGVHNWLVSAWLNEKGHGLIVGGRAYVLRTSDGGNTQQRLGGE